MAIELIWNGVGGLGEERAGVCDRAYRRCGETFWCHSKMHNDAVPREC